MGKFRQIDIENRTYQFYDDIADFKDSDVRLLKIYEKSHKNTGIYNIGYSTI